MAPGCNMGRSQGSRGSVMLWAIVQLGNLSPGIHFVVTLTCIMYQNIGADYVHPSMANTLMTAASFSRTMLPATLQKLFRNGRGKYVKESWLGLQISPNPVSLLSISASCWLHDPTLSCLIDFPVAPHPNVL